MGGVITTKRIQSSAYHHYDLSVSYVTQGWPTLAISTLRFLFSPTNRTPFQMFPLCFMVWQNHFSATLTLLKREFLLVKIVMVTATYYHHWFSTFRATFLSTSHTLRISSYLITHSLTTTRLPTLSIHVICYLITSEVLTLMGLKIVLIQSETETNRICLMRH